MKVFEKQPAEVNDYFFDFRNWLTAKEDTADSYAVEAQDGITVASHNMNTPGVVQVFVAGGQTGIRYRITCRLTTGGARVKEADIGVKVKDT